MKSFTKKIAVFLLVFLSVGVFAGCFNRVTETITINIEDVKTVLAYNEELDLSSVKVEFKKGNEPAVVYGIDELEDVLIDYGTYQVGVYGEHTITIKYKETEKIFMIMVNAPKETGFYVDTTQLESNYVVNSEIDWSKLKVFATYENSDVVELDPEMYELNISNVDMQNPGSYPVTVNYKNYNQFTFIVTITPEPVVETIIFNTEAVKKSLEYLEQINLSGVVIAVQINDEEPVNYGINDLPNATVNYGTYTPTTVGTHEITITYKNKSTKFNVTVAQPKETGFIVDTTNVKLSYSLEEELDLSGLVVKAVYQDNSQVVLGTNQYALDVTDFDNTQYGEYTIYVTYKQYAVQEFKVFVAESAQIIGETILIYSHADYTLVATNLVIKNADTNQVVEVEQITQGNYFVSQLPSGKYIATYLNSQGEPRTRELVSVDYLHIFAVGTDLVAQREARNNGEYLSPEKAPYYVGTSTPFIFDLKLQGVNQNQLQATTHLLDYKFEVKNASNEFEEVAFETIATVNGQEFTFKSAYLGKTIRATIKPKYQNNIQNPVVHEFVLNNGVNVFTHEQLKSAFGNLNVSLINIHREIDVTLSQDQFNEDGTVKNISAQYLSNYVEVNENGVLTKNTSGNAYIRYSTNVNNNHLVVNGNYFTINGKNLPLLTGNEEGYEHQPGYLGIISESKVVNSQTAIFYTHLRSSNYEANLTNAIANGYTKAQFNSLENNTVTFNNITVLGNTKTPTGDASQEQVIDIANKNSGGYSLIRFNTDGAVNNAVLRFSVIGVTSSNNGTDVSINYTIIEEAWANLVYGHGTSVTTIANSRLRYAGGSGVWIEDIESQGGEIASPTLNIDSATIIENYVSGDEPWFKAHNAEIIAVGAKSQINGGISQLGKSIVKTVTNQQTNLSYEVFNFAVVLLENYDLDENPALNQTAFPTIVFGGKDLTRSYAEFNADPRLVSDALIFPIGSYSKVNDFMTAVQGYMINNGLSQQDATNAVLFGAFNEPGAKNLEVVMNVSGLGRLTFITEFFNAGA